MPRNRKPRRLLTFPEPRGTWGYRLVLDDLALLECGGFATRREARDAAREWLRERAGNVSHRAVTKIVAIR